MSLINPNQKKEKKQRGMLQQIPMKFRVSPRNFFENLYSNESENHKEVEKFLDTYDLWKLDHNGRKKTA
jgi:hypothetical protein